MGVWIQAVDAAQKALHVVADGGVVAGMGKISLNLASLDDDARRAAFD